jgi:putative ABC transport system permease protein
VGNLLIARASARRRELTLRLALGASRWRIARQLLAESALLGAAGAVFGAWLAQWGSQILVAQLSLPGYAVKLDLTMDLRVFAFTTAVSVAAVVLFGTAPAATVSRLAPNLVLKEYGRGDGLGGRAVMRNLSVVLQVALSLALVVAASLFTRTLVQLESRDAGFNPRGVLLVSADLKRSAAIKTSPHDLFDRLTRAAASVPGVSAASASFTTPVSTTGWNTPIRVPDDSPLTRRERLSWVNAVTPGWFAALGLRMAAGRDFTDADRAGAPSVVIVNRAFERRFLSAKPALGQIVRRAPPEPAADLEVVGVVEDAVYRSLRAPMEPTLYLPLAQSDDTGSSIVLSVRSAGVPPTSLAKPLAAALEREEAAAVLSFVTLEDQVKGSLTQERLVATVGAFFGGLGLLLAAIGLYGVTSEAVTSRRAEIGIRMALGASVRRVIRVVLRRVAQLVAVGIMLGAALSAWASTYISSLLYGLQPRDPWTFAAAAALLVLVSGVAAWLPARRAARVEPSFTLRV